MPRSRECRTRHVGVRLRAVLDQVVWKLARVELQETHVALRKNRTLVAGRSRRTRRTAPSSRSCLILAITTPLTLSHDLRANVPLTAVHIVDVSDRRWFLMAVLFVMVGTTRVVCECGDASLD